MKKLALSLSCCLAFLTANAAQTIIPVELIMNNTSDNVSFVFSEGNLAQSKHRDFNQLSESCSFTIPTTGKITVFNISLIINPGITIKKDVTAEIYISRNDEPFLLTKRMELERSQADALFPLALFLKLDILNISVNAGDRILTLLVVNEQSLLDKTISKKANSFFIIEGS